MKLAIVMLDSSICFKKLVILDSTILPRDPVRIISY